MSARQLNYDKLANLEVVGIVRQLNGGNVRRKVRKHGNDSDLEGTPKWSSQASAVHTPDEVP